MGCQRDEKPRDPSPKTQGGARLVVLLAVILALVTFLSGCSGIVSGQSSQIAPPPQTYSISGAITPTVGGSGATVQLSGAANATTTADGSGNFTFRGLANGTYTITPTQAGFTFSPTSATVTISGANVTSGANFTASAVNNAFSISGSIAPAAGGSGASVSLAGAGAANTTTDSSGNYTFTGLANGTYIVTPSNPGYAFSPANQSVTINGANQTGVNFTATVAQSHTVVLSWVASTTTTVAGYNVYRSTTTGSGYAKVSGSTLITVLSYTDATAQSGTTYYYVTTAVDSTGAESGYSNETTAVIP